MEGSARSPSGPAMNTRSTSQNKRPRSKEMTDESSPKRRSASAQSGVRCPTVRGPMGPKEWSIKESLTSIDPRSETPSAPLAKDILDELPDDVYENFNENFQNNLRQMAKHFKDQAQKQMEAKEVAWRIECAQWKIELQRTENELRSLRSHEQEDKANTNTLRRSLRGFLKQED